MRVIWPAFWMSATWQCYCKRLSEEESVVGDEVWNSLERDRLAPTFCGILWGKTVTVVNDFIKMLTLGSWEYTQSFCWKSWALWTEWIHCGSGSWVTFHQCGWEWYKGRLSLVHGLREWTDLDLSASRTQPHMSTVYKWPSLLFCYIRLYELRCHLSTRGL